MKLLRSILAWVSGPSRAQQRRWYLIGRLAPWLSKRQSLAGGFFLSPIDNCAYQNAWNYAAHLVDNQRLPVGFDDPNLAKMKADRWQRVPLGARATGGLAAGRI